MGFWFLVSLFLVSLFQVSLFQVSGFSGQHQDTWALGEILVSGFIVSGFLVQGEHLGTLALGNINYLPRLEGTRLETRDSVRVLGFLFQVSIGGTWVLGYNGTWVHIATRQALGNAHQWRHIGMTCN